MSGALLSVEGLVVAYGPMPALRGITFSVDRGEVSALFGPNGAGKSTLLKAIIGLVPIRAGRILFDGQAIERMAVERRVALGLGYGPEGRRVFPGMTVRENLEVASTAARPERARRIAAIYQLFPALGENATINAWQLSGGQQQMLTVGRALIAGSRLLLLDEPSLGLAPKASRDLLASIRSIAAAGTAVLFAEQKVPAALRVADRAVVLRAGDVVHAGRADAASAETIRERSFLGA